MEDKDLFYVGILDAVGLRRELLNSSKILLDGLRRFECYALVNAEKFEHVARLKRVLDELLVLNKKFRSLMPKAPAIPQKEERVVEKPVLKSVPKSHMDVLEDELERIERRLESLR